MKSHIYNFDTVSKSEDKFRAATILIDESFNNLLEFLNPGKDSCNIKFYDTASRLSQSCDDIGSPKSGPKPFRSRSIFHVYDLVKNCKGLNYKGLLVIAPSAGLMFISQL